MFYFVLYSLLARVLIGLDEKQQQVMVNSIIGQKLSVREVESTIKNIKESAPSYTANTNSKSVPSYDFSDVKEKLKSLGFKSNSSKNKLSIEFNDENKIEEFLNYFSK